jgi:pilus assembly protein CpaF
MDHSGSSTPSITPEQIEKLKQFVLEQAAPRLREQTPGSSDETRIVTQLVKEICEKARIGLPAAAVADIVQSVISQLSGFGLIQPLLDDPTVSEIMVNGAQNVYVEENGILHKTDLAFQSDAQVLDLIKKIITPLNRRINADQPMVDGRLPDGSRVNAVIPPVAIDGPSITIRKFQRGKLGVEKLIELGTLSQHMADFLKVCVLAKFNIIVSGGTGTGKTTLLNALSSFIPEKERIITIEDAAELVMQQEHVVRMETKPGNPDGSGLVIIRDLVRNSLRMRPDRIVIGEVRGGEAMDMLQAMNTGHDGSLTTLHANTPRDAISRLETMCLMSGVEIPLKVVRQQIASAIDLIIQVSREKDGSRKITAITEVVGMEGETVVLTDIFKFERKGVAADGKVLGQLKPTGIRPQFSARLEALGYRLGAEIFGG